MLAPKSLSIDEDRHAFSKTSALTSLSTDDDLDAAWEKVVNNFRDVSKANYPNKKITMGEVLANISSQTANDTTKNKAKRVVMNVLNCVQIFGDVVAKASSTVVPAGEQCFNAVNFVIVAVKKYQKIFEDLTILLERVSVFLGSLRFYFEEKQNGNKLDPRLRLTVYRVLEHFMLIMTLAIDLTNRKSRVKVAAKEFFFGVTSEITDALAQLETLVSNCVNMQVAVIGQDLSNAARDIRTLDSKMDSLGGKMSLVTSNLGRREEQEKVQDMRNQLRNWLCIGERDFWRDYHNTIREQRTDKTGDWLCKENNAFAQWCDTESNASNVMLVTADSGRGKSFLASAAIDHIEDPAFASESRSALAYSYYQATIGENSQALSQKRTRPSSQSAVRQATQGTNRALRSIVRQLSEADKEYRDFVFQKHKHDACKMNAIQIWNELVVSYSPRERWSYFIILDGMQKADQELLETMIRWDREQTSLLRIRVFATAKTQDVSNNRVINTSSQISLDPPPHLKELVPSITDVIEVTKSRLKKTLIFRDENPQTLRVREKVLDVVTRKIQNDFARLSLVLSEIGHCVNPRQIERILDRIDEPIEVNLGRQVRDLNSKLTSEEVKEVNALISWLESCKNPYIRRRTGTTSCSLAEEYVDVKLGLPRLTPLSERINQRYSLLFEVDALDRVKWRYTDIQQYLKKDFEDQQTLKEIYKRQGKHTSKTDLEELDLLELVIQNNLNTVFGARGAELFDRYGLGEYFMSQRGEHTELICADETSNKYSVLFICLQVLCEDISLRTVNQLRDYSRRMLHKHLEWDEKHKLTPEQNKEIGRFLVKLLRNDTVIDHWSQEENLGITSCFPTNQEEDDLIWKWLEKVTTSGGLADLGDQELFSKLSNKGDSSRRSHWDYAIDRILDGWYTQERRTWATIKRISNASEPEEVHIWLKGVWLKDRDHKFDPVLLIKRLVQEADTGYYYNRDKIWILKECNDIIQKKPDTWWALFYSARALTEDDSSADGSIEDDSSAEVSTQNDQAAGSSSVLKEAISRLNTAVSTTTEDKDFSECYWTRILPLLARCQLLDLDTEGALNSYLEMMNDARCKRTLNMSMLCPFMPEAVGKFLEVASEKEVPHTTHRWLYELIASVDSSEAALAVSLAAHHVKDWRGICDTIKVLLEQLNSEMANVDDGSTTETDISGQDDEDSEIWQERSSQKLVESILANVLWHKSDKAEERMRALDLWAELEMMDVLLTVLIKHSKDKTFPELSNSDDEYDSRLTSAIRTVSVAYRNVQTPSSIRAHFIAARMFMNLGSPDQAQRLISKILKNKAYDDDTTSDEQSEEYYDDDDTTLDEQLKEYGRACFVLDKDQCGHDLFAHMTTHNFAKHEGCQHLCGPESPDAEAVTYLCRDCMCFLKPRCLEALKNGVWTAGFCDPRHDHIELRRPMTKDGRNDRATIDLVRDIGIEHGWLKVTSDDDLKEQENGVLEMPRSRASFHSIDEVTIGAQE